jgi:broad specificity phosphatase PhoE
VAKTVELRRHTDNDGDVLTPEGVRAALEIGRGLDGDYQVAVSTGAQRATQAVACMLAGLGGSLRDGVVVEPGLRSDDEDRWRAVAGEASGKDLASFREVDADFVDAEARALGAALQRVFDLLNDGGRALVVGHSPTNEAAVLGLTGQLVDPMGKGDGVLVAADGGYSVQRLS